MRRLFFAIVTGCAVLILLGACTQKTPTHTHFFTEWSVTLPATCVQKGKEQSSCECGACEIREIPATGVHAYGAWETLATATCASNGKEERTCECGAVEQRVVLATGAHSYDAENTCTACGDYKDKGVVFTLRGESYTVSGYTGDAAEVILPARYRGKPVTAIGENAFRNCLSITAVYVPASVSVIEKGAFCADSCEAVMQLERVSFAENSELESIGERAFYLCTNLVSITIPRTVKSIGDYAFAGARSPLWGQRECPMGLLDVRFAAGSALEHIGNGAFQYCASLVSITVPEAVISMGSEVFFGCDALVSVHFENTNGWARSHIYSPGNRVPVAASELADPATAAQLLKTAWYWSRTT